MYVASLLHSLSLLSSLSLSLPSVSNKRGGTKYQITGPSKHLFSQACLASAVASQLGPPMRPSHLILGSRYAAVCCSGESSQYTARAHFAFVLFTVCCNYCRAQSVWPQHIITNIGGPAIRHIHVGIPGGRDTRRDGAPSSETK